MPTCDPRSLGPRMSLKAILDAQYEAFNVADSATDPVQFVHRTHADPADREIVGVHRRGAGVRARRQRDGVGRTRRSTVMGAHPARYVRDFDPPPRRARADADRAPLDPRRRPRRADAGAAGDAARARIDRGRVRRRPRSGRGRRRARARRLLPRAPAPSTSAPAYGRAVAGARRLPLLLRAAVRRQRAASG